MSNTKHIVNTPKTIVLDSLRGLIYQNPNVRLDEEYKVIHVPSHPKNQVALISGGGSGHEPSFAGYVGEGLLSAAVCGNVFASPNVGQIERALRLVNNEKGTLIVINQYTGDVLHFGLAKEQFAAKNPNSKLRLLAVGDDVSVGRAQGKMVGRRGLAGTVFTYKIAGALATKGADIDEVYGIAKWVSERLASIAMGLEHCHIPGTAKEETRLSAEQMELGMGIHNEPGLEVLPTPTTRELLTKMVDLTTSTSDPDRSFVPFKNDGKDEVVLLVNNLGGISELELGGIVGNAVEVLREKKFTVRRVLAGAFMTSLNMPGFSITLFLLPRDGDDSPYKSADLLDLLDAEGDAPGWKWHAAGAEPGVHEPSKETAIHTEQKNAGKAVVPPTPNQFIAAVKQACEDIIVAEPLITKYDTIAGDGDCGLCLKAGADGILAAIEAGKVTDKDVVAGILDLAEQIEIFMDGTSGALYSIFFNALASGLRGASESLNSTEATSELWAKALASAKDTLYQYTRARTPSRTLVDPLEAFVSAFAASPSDFAGSVKAGQDAAELTKTYEAKAGRAAYVGRDALKDAQVPDPGAWGVGVILQGVLKVVGGSD